LADQLQGKPNPWERLYRVDRLDTAHRPRGFEKESTGAAPHAPPPLPTAALQHFNDLQPCQGRQDKVDGEPVAAYRNEQGELMIVSGRCTHMGCALKWNGAESSWDCPCHGSRFRPDGAVIEGPATAPLARHGPPPQAPAQPHGEDNSEDGDEL
jgi:nitrite reductase/ring-hydroxylating ferredoxin subunit